jgi:hypothetical protein
MIRDFKEITAENPVKEVWKLLRFFRDVKFASEQHRRILNISEEQYKKHKKYIEKQAKQIGYCIRQAEEYFQASSQVGLATRPNLLYYGAVNLSQALILLKNNGEYSLDLRREQERHKHHGLEFKKSVKDFKPDQGTESFFNLLQCSVYSKPESDKEQQSQKQTPWGHFPLFYKSLIPSAYGIPIEIHNPKSGHGILINQGFFIKKISQSVANILDIENLLIPNKFNSLEIIKLLPDMYFFLNQVNINPELLPGSIKIIEYQNEESEENKRRIEEIHIFSIDKILPNWKSDLKNSYAQRFTDTQFLILTESDTNISFQLSRQYFPESEDSGFDYPDLVDDITGRKFYIVKPETYIPEPAAHFILLFCLGMLCRYYPDIWIKAIDENVQVAELTDSLLNIIYRKFPNLILDQMTETKHYVHS